MNKHCFISSLSAIALIAAVGSSAVTGEAINICTGRDTSQARIVELVLQASGSSLQPAVRPSAAAPPWFALKVGLSREKAKRLLGWEPEVSIEQGVTNVLRWVDQERALAASPIG